MATPTPVKIFRIVPAILSIEWSDAYRTDITTHALRDACPCAACKGETIMGTTYSFGMKVIKPGMYDLKTIRSVGNYAIQPEWHDGHDTGIYTWDILRELTLRHNLSADEIEALANSESEHQSILLEYAAHKRQQQSQHSAS